MIQTPQLSRAILEMSIVDALELCDVATGEFYNKIIWTITSSAGGGVWNANLALVNGTTTGSTFSDEITIATISDSECPRNLQSAILGYPYFYVKAV